MAKLTRVTAKVFGENASLTVGSSGIGQFGSAKAGTFNITGDVATIQALPAWATGFRDAVTASSRFPALEEMTGLAKVLSYQNAYVLQEGISEWDAGTTYNIGSIVKVLDESNKVLLYQSIINDNLNTPVTNDTAWEKVELGGGARNIGEIVTSSIPLTDAGLHLLDGALIQGSGSYSAFVDYIAGLVGTYPTLFDTEANWQTAVTTYGVCAKFVYDSVNNTVRLPKYGSQIFTKSSSVASTVPVKGNGKALGLYDGETYIGVEGANNYLSGRPGYYNSAVGQSFATASVPSKSLGLTNEGSKSGVIVDTVSLLTQYPLNCYYYIVVTNSTKTQIQVDIDEIATDLNGKLDKDLNNISNTVSSSAKNTIMNWSLVDWSSRIYQTSTGNTDITYTCPSKGWINYTTLCSGNGNIASVSVNNWLVNETVGKGSTAVQALTGGFPVDSGDVVLLHPAYTSSSNYLYFFPLKGV